MSRYDDSCLLPTGISELEERLAGKSDNELVFLFDLLQRVEARHLPDFMKKLAELPARFFFVIPLAYSDRLLDDGSNVNKIVETREWWAELLSRWFAGVEPVRAHGDHDAAFVTFPISAEAKRAIDRLSPKIDLAKHLERIGSSAVVLARTFARTIHTKADLVEAVAGKSVSVVGNARSLGRKRLGKDIDANDIVVRFNRAPIISRDLNGYRTDWLATSVPLEPEFIEALAVDRILWMSRRRHKMNMGVATARNLYLHPKQDVRRLAERAGVSRPSTGLMMIDLLAQLPCRSIELYGFDFYKSQSLSGHQSIDTTPHAFDREEIHVTDLIATDSRFKICR